MDNVKGILATATSGASAITVWANEIEVFLRIIVSILGIISALYAIAYWRTKAIELRNHNRCKHSDDCDHNKPNAKKERNK